MPLKQQQLFQWPLGLMFGGSHYYYQPVSLLDCEQCCCHVYEPQMSCVSGVVCLRKQNVISKLHRQL